MLDPRTTAVARTLAIFILIVAFFWGARDTIVAFTFDVFLRVRLRAATSPDFTTSVCRFCFLEAGGLSRIM